MIAKTVNEVQNFERGQDPYQTLDLGRKLFLILPMGYSYIGPFRNRDKVKELLADLPQEVYNIRSESQEMELSDDREMDAVEEIIEYYEYDLQKLGFEFIDEDMMDNPELELLEIKEIGMNESQNFERGQDSKQALGIGVWRNGFRIDSPGQYEIPIPPQKWYVRIDFKEDEWHFSRKAFEIEDITETKVLPHMEKILSKLPVITFKYYYNQGQFPGLFGDWPEDFPFKLIPFVANVLEDEERSFLIDPDGYDYPRYMTELV
jgi:hypothetical protein